MFPLRDDRPTSSPPLVTVFIMVVCAVVFLYERFALDDYSLNYFIDRYALEPAHVRVLTLLTSLFLHAGWSHIIGNMIFLWAFGKSLEDAMGHARFLGFYLLCGIAAGLVHLAFNYYSRTPTIGASGAIAGIMGAYLIKFPKAWIHTLVFILVFVTTTDIPAWFFVIFWFVTQLFNGYGSIAHTQVSDGGTAWFAHIGGFLAGMALVTVMGTRNRYLRSSDHRW